MMELKEGMYARTNAGIKEIIYYEYDDGYENGHKIHFKGDKYAMWYTEEELPKVSYNIAELLEVGDYVNGHQVYEVDRVCCRITLNGGDIGSEAFRLTYLRPALGNNMGIKSIVTKEQFESMSYEVSK